MKLHQTGLSGSHTSYWTTQQMTSTVLTHTSKIKTVAVSSELQDKFQRASHPSSVFQPTQWSTMLQHASNPEVVDKFIPDEEANVLGPAHGYEYLPLVPGIWIHDDDNYVVEIVRKLRFGGEAEVWLRRVHQTLALLCSPSKLSPTLPRIQNPKGNGLSKMQ